MINGKFTEYNSSKKLKQLAENPIDLSKENVLSPERLDKFHAVSCQFRMLYGTERINDDTMKALGELAQESDALIKLEQMQAGEIVNVIQGYASENRPALHTATRDFFDNPNKAKAAIDAARLAKDEVDKLKAFLEKINRENRFTDMIQIGIGGSDLGPRAHYVALQHLLKSGRKGHFISNVDPDDAVQVIREVDLKNTLVVVVSKSGSTLETLTNEQFLRARFKEAGLKPEEHFIAVTGKGSPLDNKDNYLESFHIWDWIGGRYSTCSMVGGVLLGFAFGFDVFWDFLKGVNAMDHAALNRDLSKNLPLLGALLGIWNHNFLNYPTLAIIPYSQALLRYTAHIQQVDMESNGKHIDKKGNRVNFQTGPIIWGEPGTNTQHSFFQLIHQGTAIIPLEFIGFKHSQYHEDFDFKGTNSQEKLLSNLFAQSIALATGQKNENPNKVFMGNRPSHILLANQLDPYTLGNLLGYFENKIVLQGFIWGINSFDQEGVELGKVLAKKIIDCFAAKNGKASEASYPIGEAFLKQLDKV